MYPECTQNVPSGGNELGRGRLINIRQSSAADCTAIPNSRSNKKGHELDLNLGDMPIEGTFELVGRSLAY